MLMIYDVLRWLQISILDPEILLLLFSGSLPGNSSGIASLKFAVSQALKEEPAAESTEAEGPDSEQPKSTVSVPNPLLYAVSDDATIAVLDGATGDCLGSRPVQPEIASKTLCIDLLGEQILSPVYNHVAICRPAYEGLVYQSNLIA